MSTFIFPLRIYIDDTDFGGIVYHANYLKFFERARSEWAEQVGVGMDWQREMGIFFAVRYANIEFLKPARVHEKVEVVSCIKEIRKASMIYDQYLRSSATPDTILCKAEVKIACVDQNMKPRSIPDLWVTLLINTENKT